MPPQRRLEVTEAGGAEVVRFSRCGVLDQATWLMVNDELLDLIDRPRRPKLLLHFGQVETISSAALGKLIVLRKKIIQRDGTIRLAAMPPGIAELFAATKLDQLFDIYDDETAALADWPDD